MKCFCVTRGNARFKVLPVAARYGLDVTYCCDTDAQRRSLIDKGVPRNRIVLTDVPKGSGIQGVSLARDFVCRKLMPRGKWSLWIDDNVYRLTGLRPRQCRTDSIDFNDGTDWRDAFDRELEPVDFNYHLAETIKRAEAVGTIFCGFANETNFFFRGRHWQDYGYCRTQLALYKNDGSAWMPFSTMMLEDLYKSIDVVCRYGQVVINRYMKPIKPMFEAGGIGSFNERLPWLQDNCRRLVAMYPDLLKYDGNGKQYGTEANEFHVTFAKRSRNTVNRWRAEHGYV